jgi:hypothetical protein
MILTYPQLQRAFFAYLGNYRGEGGASGLLRVVDPGFVWEFTRPGKEQPSEVALIGDGSFVALGENPQVHWYNVADLDVGSDGGFRAVYQSTWFDDWRLLFVGTGDGSLTYGREIRGRVVQSTLRRVEPRQHAG